MTAKVNRVHQFVAIQQTDSTTDQQKINRVHQFVAIQQTDSTTDQQKINRIHMFVIVKGAAFKLAGADLEVAKTLAAGNYPVRIRATDANGASFEKDFNITVT